MLRLIYYMQYGGYRGGSPAKQRREAEREARARAEKAEDTGNNSNDTTGKSNAEKAELVKGEMIAEEANIEALKEDVEIVEYELTVAAHKKCKNYDIIEAIEANLEGNLNDLKVEEMHCIFWSRRLRRRK